MLPELLLVSLYAAEEKGFPQAQGLLVRGGGVIPYGWRDCVGWTVAVAVPSPSVLSDFAGVSWWERRLSTTVAKRLFVAESFLLVPLAALASWGRCCFCVCWWCLPLPHPPSPPPPNEGGESQAHGTWRHQGRLWCLRPLTSCGRGPNWCHLDAPVSLGEMWESQAGGVGYYLLKLLVHLVLLVVDSQGNKGLPGLPFLTRMEQAVLSRCPSVGGGLIRVPLCSSRSGSPVRPALFLSLLHSHHPPELSWLALALFPGFVLIDSCV